VTKGKLECRPCYQKFRYRSDCVGRECLLDLTPDEVLERIMKTGFLKNLPAPAR
jgi:hypothetical protein